jgi:phosphoserine phosphatase
VFDGTTTGPIVDGERKAMLLGVMAQSEGVRLEQVMAVGDGANDLKMMGVAGLGVAFNAKKKVQEEADVRINQRSLMNLMFLLGYTEDEITSLCQG